MATLSSVDGRLSLEPEDAKLVLAAIGDQRGPIKFIILGSGWAPLLHQLRECAAMVPPPLNGDRVWYGMPDGRKKVIVRAKTKAGARRLLEAAGWPVSAANFNGWWSETGNRASLCAALRSSRGCGR